MRFVARAAVGALVIVAACGTSQTPEVAATGTPTTTASTPTIEVSVDEFARFNDLSTRLFDLHTLSLQIGGTTELERDAWTSLSQEADEIAEEFRVMRDDASSSELGEVYDILKLSAEAFASSSRKTVETIDSGDMSGAAEVNSLFERYLSLELEGVETMNELKVTVEVDP